MKGDIVEYIATFENACGKRCEYPVSIVDTENEYQNKENAKRIITSKFVLASLIVIRRK